MNTPYITPEKLLSKSRLPIEVDVAFICFCPMPSLFEKFKIDVEFKNRLFLHTHNLHILFGQYHDYKFIVISEVYGGPIGVTTVEELKYYGIKKIIGLGFVGSFDNNIKTGNIVFAEKSLIELGTTPHYLTIKDDYTFPSLDLNIDCVKTCIWTTNALYREYRDDILFAMGKGCTVVNMDTSHLYASCQLLNIPCAYYAIVSDVININSKLSDFEEKPENSWDNDLTATINGNLSPVSQSMSKLVESLLDSIFKN
ncbi:Purine phosphorylase family 1 protein [Acanthamoeba polyphaga moumouvirus]|uniref:Purine phosphorylase family 1 protein n=1 Tax=Acanthamoeba polyphaga moumouvirus TaxID=1269028 RepID=L7RCK7_9VIRU|nr:Purine phosphorylase family 1 protein [Acanthamoeba polyphaga moumouvirus]AGC02339.1 Purine phosphorylase family 1 protein [Acanthamoeba polyphaga moumouvirus]